VKRSKKEKRKSGRLNSKSNREKRKNESDEEMPDKRIIAAREKSKNVLNSNASRR